MTQTSFTHIVVRHDAVNHRKVEIVYVALSLLDACRMCRRLIQAAARVPGSTALYAVWDYSSASLFQKGIL